MVETANRDINLICIRCGQEGQRCAARRTKGAHPSCPEENPGLAVGETKLGPPKRRPGNERRAAAAATIGAVAMGEVIGLSCRLVTHRSTQTAARNDLHRLVRPLSADAVSKRYFNAA